MTRPRLSIAIGLCAASVAALLALAGCADPEPTTEGGTGGSWEVITVEVDGRKVPCVVWDGYRAGGITCDWQAQR